MKFPSLAALALFAAAPVMAAPLTVDFETLPAGYADPVGEHYAGQGVSFGSNAYALQNQADFSYYSNAPTALGVMYTFGTDSAMNVASGFVDQISFWYSSLDTVVGAVSVWSGLNGTGTLLASFDLLANAQAGGCNDTGWCNFDSVSTDFVGVAYSVTFADDYNILYDNIAIDTNDVPEPASALLVALGLAGLAAGKRRRR